MDDQTAKGCGVKIMKLQGEHFFIGFSILGCVLYLLESMSYNESARFSPILVGVILMGLLVIQFISSIRTVRNSSNAVADRVKDHRVAGMIAAMLATVVLSYWFGLLFTMALALCLYFYFYVKLKPAVSAGIAVLTCVALYVIFVELFSIPLSVGVIARFW